MKNSRRKFIHTCLGLVSAGFAMSSCGTKDRQVENTEDSFPGNPCEDMQGLNHEDLAKREQLGYEKTSPIPESRCDNCQLYIPPKEQVACGGCMLFKGPVYPEAYCTYWAPQM